MRLETTYLLVTIIVLPCVVEGQSSTGDVGELEARLEAKLVTRLEDLHREDAQRIQRLEKLRSVDAQRIRKLEELRSEDARMIQQLKQLRHEDARKIQQLENGRRKDAERALRMQTKLEDTVLRLSVLENQLTGVSKQLGDLGENVNEQLKYENLSAPHIGHVASKRLLDTPASSPSTVAFSSRLSTTAKELGLHHTIPFDTVVINEGNAFDPLLHVFTCPTTGVYVFMTALIADIHENTATEIVLNGNSLSLAYSAGATGSHGYDQGFNSVITNCNAGDRVWVQIHSHQGTTVLGDRWCSFSGFLLH